MSIITLSPEMRQLIAGGELWDAETPNSAYRGRINNSRLFWQSGTPTLTKGKIGNAYTFPGGTNSYLSIARDNVLWLPISGTLSFWWYIDFSNGWATTNSVTAIDFGGHGQTLIRREANPNRINLRNQTSSTGHLTPNGTFPAVTGWSHIVVQWNGSSIFIWINGVKYTATGTFPGFDSSLMTANARIGSPGIPCDHKVEQLALFPGQILSDSNVLHLYNSGNGRAWGIHRAIPQDFLSIQIG